MEDRLAADAAELEEGDKSVIEIAKEDGSAEEYGIEGDGMQLPWRPGSRGIRPPVGRGQQQSAKGVAAS